MPSLLYFGQLIIHWFIFYLEQKTSYKFFAISWRELRLMLINDLICKVHMFILERMYNCIRGRKYNCIRGRMHSKSSDSCPLSADRGAERQCWGGICHLHVYIYLCRYIYIYIYIQYIYVVYYLLFHAWDLGELYFYVLSAT